MSSLTRSDVKDLSITLISSADPNRHIDELEIEKTVGIIFSVKKMISRFITSGVINDKLMTNNIVIIFNFYGAHITHLLFKSLCSTEQMGVVKSIMKFLKIYPVVDQLDGNYIMDAILKDYQVRYQIGGKR